MGEQEDHEIQAMVQKLFANVQPNPAQQGSPVQQRKEADPYAQETRAESGDVAKCMECTIM